MIGEDALNLESDNLITAGLTSGELGEKSRELLTTCSL